MKKVCILSIIIVNYFIAYSQNVGIGTTAPVSKLHIKGSSDISQLTIDANAAQSNTNPLIRLRDFSGKDLLHVHTDDSTNIFIGLHAGSFNDVTGSGGGLNNTFIGSFAGYYNTTGNNNTANGFSALAGNYTGSYNTAYGSYALNANSTGYNNTANGNYALFGNRTGYNNTANGNYALSSNYTGYYNTANGAGALDKNTTGYDNVANGAQALLNNIEGYSNTANGTNALYSNATGNFNTANGSVALYSNTTGSVNTVNGYQALYANTTGSANTATGWKSLALTKASYYNTALGYNAGASYDNGYNNVFLGANVDVNGAGYYNVIAIGQGTICTAPSQVTIGNGATNSYRAYANWSNISDGRFKKNVRENVPGLDFITKLRPVTYSLDATGLDMFLHKNDKSPGKVNDVAKSINNKVLQEKEAVTYTGFVAQEVETTAKQLGFNFSGVDAPKDNNDFYGLRYAEFVVPLVKAVQEQQQIINELKNVNIDLQKQIDELKALIKK